MHTFKEKSHFHVELFITPRNKIHSCKCSLLKLNRLFMRLLIIKHLTAYSAPVFHKIFETLTLGLVTKSFFYYLKFHRGTHIFLGGEKARKGNMQKISLRR